MSQRVQKGNTVFKPVARPRVRTESRQASVLPELMSSVGTSRVHDGPNQRASGVRQEVPAEPTGVDMPSAIVNGPHPISELHGHPSFSSADRLHPSPPVIRATPSRMPPVIGSSQQSTSHNHNHTPISTMPHETDTVSFPNRLDPLRSPVPAAESHMFNDFVHVSPHIAGIHDPFSTIPFPIDALQQIDPQLMDPPSAHAPPSFASQELPSQELSFGSGASVALNDISAVKLPRARRSRKRSEAVADATEHDVAGSSTTSEKRRRTKKAHTEGDENSVELTAKKRKSSGTGRSRNRPPSPPPFDPAADPGEELDPTVITMAALCDDTGRGRVSSRAAQVVSNHAAWRAANREKRARIKTIVEAKKYGRNLEDEEEAANRNTLNATPTGAPVAGARMKIPAQGIQTSGAVNVNADAGDKDVDAFDYGEDLTLSQYNPQVRIGANGETIIDEDSLFVNRNEEHHTEDYTHVEESDFTKFVNSATYSKKARGSRWSAEETELFYDALSQFGENYELISYVLPGRDRKACKNKFKTEDKRDSARITYCLNNRRPYDIATLSRMTGKDFSGPTPEIRAPTPHRSIELQTTTDVHISPSSPPRVVRKKSKTPSTRDADIEVVGYIDDVEAEEASGVPVSA